MSTTNRYKSLKRADAILREAGYLEAWVSLKDDFDTFEVPTLSNVPVIGEAYTIAGDHAFKAGKEPIKIYIKKDVLEAAGESIGDKGSLRLKWKPKLFIKGDGPIVLETVNNLLNEEVIVFVRDQESPAKFIQFGNELLPCETGKAANPTGTLGGGGSKGYEIEFDSYNKFFYNGTLPERA